MASATIDNLQIKISATATDAASALQKLADSLKSVREALGKTGKDGQTFGAKINRNLTDLNNAISKLDPNKFKKLAELSDGVAISLGAINTSLKAINLEGITKLSALSSGLRDYAAALREVKDASKGINFSKLPKIPEVDTPSNPTEEPPLDGEEESTGESSRVKIGRLFASVIAGLGKLRGLSAKIRVPLQNIAERFKGLGKNIQFSTGALGTFFKAIGRIAFYRAIRSAIKAVGEAFAEGVKNAYLYSQQTEGFERLANSLDRLKSVASQMVNQIGAFYGEFRQFIQPAIEWIIEKVRKLTEFLTELFAALNGSDVYEYALLEDLKWQEATADLKKYKQQLLGLDEINNLSDQQSGDKKEDDATKKYKLKPVRESLREIGKGWQSITKTISDAYDEIGGLAYLPAGMLALGSILLFTGHPLLGIALVMEGVTWSIQEYEYNNEDNKQKIDKFFEEYKDLFGTGSAAAIAIGTMLLFIPGHRALGLGLILGGKMLDNLVNDKVKFSWDGLLKKIRGKFEDYKAMFVQKSPAAVAIGALLLFVPGLRGVGLALIKGGCAGLFIGAMDHDWNGLLNNLKGAWAAIKAWFEGTVKYELNDIHNKVEELLHWDLNDDGKIGKLPINPPKVVELGGTELLEYGKLPNEPKLRTPTARSLTIQNLEMALYGDSSSNDNPSYISIQNQIGTELGAKVVDNLLGGNSIGDMLWENLKYNILQYLPTKFKAVGGVVSQGSLFYAGEAGAEFVGNIGNTSAVANTGQMTEAIYKAAYMGMSQALKENGGNGFGGFEPATTDDLFIAMRKKASNFNKRTGESAFA